MRSARALPSASTVEASAAACATDPPTRPPASLPASSPLLLCFPLLLGRTRGVQPAAEPRHVQRHRHGAMFRVRSARALPSASTVGPPCCLRHRPPHPTLPPACPHVAPPPMLSLVTRQDAWAFNQPLSLDTSSVTDMGVHVLRALRACPALSLHSRGLPAACATDHPTPPSRLLARMSPLLLCFPFLLGRARRRSTSR